MSEYLGEVDGYTPVPVSTFNYGTANVYLNTSRGWANGWANGTSTSTTYVPMPTKFPRWGTFAIFYRRVTPEERVLLDASFKK